MNKKWTTQQNRTIDRLRVDHKYMKANPEDFGYCEEQFEKKTIPGQTMTVKEMVTRYEKGRPIPQE